MCRRMETMKTTRHTALAMPSDRVARCRSAPSWSCFCNWTAARWRRRPSSARRTLCALATTFSPLCSLLDRQRRRQRPPVMCSRHLRSRDCRRPSNGRKNGLASNRALDSLLTGFFRCRTHKAWRLKSYQRVSQRCIPKQDPGSPQILKTYSPRRPRYLKWKMIAFADYVFISWPVRFLYITHKKHKIILKAKLDGPLRRRTVDQKNIIAGKFRCDLHLWPFDLKV